MKPQAIAGIGIIIIVTLCIFIVSYYCIPLEEGKTFEDGAYWMAAGQDELQHALSVTLNTATAHGVILFVGDGMGPNTVTAARIARYGEGGRLSFEKFPSVGVLKTYSVDKQVPDSASTATALFCGVKANYETSGVDATVKLGDCEASLKSGSRVDSVLDWAIRAGKATGFVTTTRVMHATPSGLFAHSADRHWECETVMPGHAKQCKDIARQLIEDEPGRSFNVIMGGGRQCLVSNVTGSEADPVDSWSCYSQDGRDLIAKWQQDKSTRHLNHELISNNNELKNLNYDNTDYVLGIFANGHLKYDHDRDDGPDGMPSLKEMTEAAIKVLKKKKNGYVLVVEGGMIDIAHHRGLIHHALGETLALDDAVQAAVDETKGQNGDQTLIIVTSDHSHTLSINGYPDRGNSIFDIAEKSKFDKKPYTTLTYATGGPGSSQIENGGRRNITNDDTTSYDYVPQATIETDENTHGGSDVHVYATGPFAHLFHSVHEQSYVAHVISYAARIGPYKDVPSRLFLVR